MRGFADLGDLPEDDRIALIRRAAAAGEIVGFFVEDDAKADRYIRKLGSAVRVIDRKPNVLVKGTVFVRVGPRES